MTEVWKPIYRYDGKYEVSNKGRVRGLDRSFIDSMGRRQNIKGRVLKPNITKRGYCLIRLSVRGKAETMQLHRVVADAFIGPSDKPVNHKDRNPINNCVSNLEYVSYRENTSHWIDNNTGLPRGVRKRNHMYQARVYRKGKQWSLGCFTTAEEAGMAYLKDIAEESRYV